jgi:hypothetical protein
VVGGGCIQDEEHEWGHLENPAGSAYRLGPLACVRCGTVWPGEPLPEPYLARNPGYGDLEGFVPWGERVDAMVDELTEVTR